MNLVHPMSYKPQIFTGRFFQSAFDKYVITYQTIGGNRMPTRHLVESGYCKTLGPLKGAPTLGHFSLK